MRILWISSIAWKNSAGYPYAVNGAGAVSGSLFQQSLIEGLECLGHTVDIVSDYPYAIGNNVCHQVNWSHRPGADDVAVKTIDIPYYSLIYKAKSLKTAVKQKVKENQYDMAIAYLIHQPYMDAVAYAKKLDANIKTILICPDLPDMMDMSLSQKKLKAFLKKLDMKRIRALYEKMDGFVLFTDAMKERVCVGEKPYTVIEGVASVDGLDIAPVQKENFIMYAGTLHKHIGIEQIIESLQYVDEDVKGIFFGTGELEGYIKELSEKDSKVIYGGFANRNELFEYEKKALALVNARNPNDAFTKYSFPSKTFEYLYSGTPFITTKLAGVPEEYSKHLFEIHDNSPRKIAEMVNYIKKADPAYLAEKSQAARDFVLNEKNKTKQSQRLIDFMKIIKEGS